MRLEYFEDNLGLTLKLIPQTTAEVAELARYVLNAKKEFPQVDLSVHGEEPIMHIVLNKVGVGKQTGYITKK